MMPLKVDIFFSKFIPDHIEIIDLDDDFCTSKLKGQIKVKGQIFNQLNWGSFAPYMRQIFPKSNQSSSVRHNFSSRTKIPGAAISFPASVTRFFVSVSTSSDFLIFKNSPDMGLGSLLGYFVVNASVDSHLICLDWQFRYIMP